MVYYCFFNINYSYDILPWHKNLVFRHLMVKSSQNTTIFPSHNAPVAKLFVIGPHWFPVLVFVDDEILQNPVMKPKNCPKNLGISQWLNDWINGYRQTVNLQSQKTPFLEVLVVKILWKHIKPYETSLSTAQLRDSATARQRTRFGLVIDQTTSATQVLVGISFSQGLNVGDIYPLVN